ncbi:MAG TPA: glycosyltransferase family 39 protein [Terriglobales bacterium]
MANEQRPTTNSQRMLTDWLLLAGFCGFLFFFGLSYFGLIGPDEPRYAQIAREMLERHEWITPTLSGKPWLEKPILYYWEVILAYRVLGVSDWAARLPSAVDATLMVVAVYAFLRRFRAGFHLDGALMTASAAGVIGFGRAASMDMPLAATFTIGLLAWYAWHESGRKLYLATFHLSLGLATLAKGPVAPFLAAVIILLFAVARGQKALFWRTWWPGVLVFCVAALPWYIAAQLENPQFLWVFILEHNLARFGTNLYRHVQPFWFYVPVTLAGLVPWTVFVVAAVAEGVRGFWRARRERAQLQDGLGLFLLIWLAVPFLFFSLSRSKLPGYILPALPAGTLLLAEFVRQRVGDSRRPGMVVIVLHGAIAAAPLPALMMQYLSLQQRPIWGGALALSLILGALLATGIAVTVRSSAGLRTLRFVTLVPVILTVAALLRIGAPLLDAKFSARPLAMEIAAMGNERLPMAVFQVSREVEFGLHFYRNQSIARYERHEVPAGEHLVVAPQGSLTQLKAEVSSRRVSYLGTYQPQQLDYYWVAAAR